MRQALSWKLQMGKPKSTKTKKKTGTAEKSLPKNEKIIIRKKSVAVKNESE